MDKDHSFYLTVCLELGRKALAKGNPPVGSVVVRRGEIIGVGEEAGKTKGDITCHAEIEAIRDALHPTKTHDLSDCILYTTHEPCLMCSYVIRHHRIREVVFGVEVPHAGGYSSAHPVLVTADIPIWGAPPTVIRGVKREECQQLSFEYRQKSNHQP